MSAVRTFPVLLETFFTDRLIRQRQASPHTLASYRDSFCLLLAYARQKLRKTPSEIMLSDLDTPFLGAFLDHLEHEQRTQPERPSGRHPLLLPLCGIALTRTQRIGATGSRYAKQAISPTAGRLPRF